MGPASPQPTLGHLRRSLAGIDPSLTPHLASGERLIGIVDPIDRVLGGGLVCGALHELAPAGPMHLGAASGFALGLAAKAQQEKHDEILWIVTDFVMAEGGGPYGPGLELFGLATGRLLVLRVPKPIDVLWAMEEALRCRALCCVIAELTGEAQAADLTATRRLALAAREGAGLRNSGFGLLLRHKASHLPSAAMTRWNVTAVTSAPDALGKPIGNLGYSRFDLSLRKNRRGPSGRWIIEWNPHVRTFLPTLSVGLAASAFDRPDRAPAVHVG